jgi:hypothetical protein
VREKREWRKPKNLLGATKYNNGEGTPLQLFIPP